MGNITKTNRVLSKGNKYLIYLNLPDDFVYDISTFIIEYNLDNKNISILEDQIPENIKENILKYYDKNIEEFVRFVEKNLEVFLSGKIPLDTNSCPSILNEHNDAFEKKDKVNPTRETNDVSETTFIHSNEDTIKKLPDDFVFPINKLETNNLRMDIKKRNIILFVCKRLNIQVKCNKCKKFTNIEESKYCECGNLLKVTYLSSFDSEYLGSLFLEGCKFLCINPSKFQFNCEKCDSNYESKKYGIGEKFRLSCWECNTEIAFNINKITLIEKKKQVFKIGEELPNKGACKHYKKSYRWFRFPCCNSVFPCDICHDNESNHEYIMANKMICGLCSREQGLGNKCDCGMSLKRTTTYWEGGKGNRNKATMSKKDSRKYTGGKK